MHKVDQNKVQSQGGAKQGAPAFTNGSASVQVNPDAKQYKRLGIELGLSPELVSQVQARVSKLPAVNLTADQLKTLAANAHDGKRVDAAWAKAMQQLDGKAPSWAGAKIDLSKSSDPRERMLFSEAENLHAGLKGMHKRTPEAQLRNLEATLNQHPYGDIDTGYIKGDYVPTPEQMANHVVDTYKLRALTTAILAGVDPQTLGITRD